MPNRILRDGILSSELVDQLDYAEEVFYRRLMSVADDYGRFSANLQILRSSCYPLRTDRVRVADVSRWIAACVKTGLVVLYKAADGKPYLEIQRFGQQVRSKSKYPDPTGCEIATDSTCEQLLSNVSLARATNTHTDTSPNTTPTPTTRAPARLHGIPASVEAVIEYGKTCMPYPVSEDVCRAFWAHYEGQARTNPNGDLFWVTSGNAVITNWKVRLPEFGSKQYENHRNGPEKPRQLTLAEKQMIEIQRQTERMFPDHE